MRNRGFVRSMALKMIEDGRGLPEPEIDKFFAAVSAARERALRRPTPQWYIDWAYQQAMVDRRKLRAAHG